MDTDRIDFVMPWVDGSDPAWQAVKRRYEAEGENASPGDVDANADCRWRDYGLLRYWFRAVERFAPWVGRVFFVTCGQKPDWLDESNPKLRLVNHADYIPEEWLPTFQARTIELNLHRIEDLSERFVFFNDDMFLLRDTKPGTFFRRGLPVIPCDLAVPRWIGYSNSSRTALNNAGILKHSMDVDAQIRMNLWKFVNVRALGFLRAAKNLASFLVNRVYIPGTFGHLPMPHLKSTLAEIWRRQPNVMERTSKYRFRTNDSVNQWLVRLHHIMKGEFSVRKPIRNAVFTLGRNNEELARTVREQKIPMICINDASMDTQTYTDSKREIQAAFDALLPQPSKFEKG